MSDKKPTEHITTSYAYAKRGELPSEPSDFYHDAGIDLPRDFSSIWN